MAVIKLSAVIITKNEERIIGRCLDSVLSVADEIIVLDSLSTDNTIDIARARGAKVVQRAWEGYSGSKNYANSLSSYDYILSIDADEVLSAELITSINNFKRNATADACEVNRLTNFCGEWIRHSGWYPEYKIRLFKKGAAQWKGSVHEALDWSQQPSVYRLHGDLLHYSFPTIKSYLAKIQVYASLAAEADFKKGKKYSLILNGILKPYFMFVRKYFLKLGILDGKAGLIIAVSSAYERFLRYCFFREMRK